MFRSLLNFFQKDGPMNEMLFWLPLLFLKGISKAITDPALYVFLEGTTSEFICRYLDCTDNTFDKLKPSQSHEAIIA